MDADEVKRYVCRTFEGINTVQNDGDKFFIYDPDRNLPQYWVCIVNPGEGNMNGVQDLLAEAYEFAARKYANQQTRHASSPEG